jgi:SOS-response transcriptional repressor LexA
MRKVVGSIRVDSSMKGYKSREECMEAGMTEVQCETFEIIEEYWKKYGFSPSYRDIAQIRGVTGIAGVKKTIDRLIKLGVVKRIDRTRSVRPVYIKFRNYK